MSPAIKTLGRRNIEVYERMDSLEVGTMNTYVRVDATKAAYVCVGSRNFLFPLAWSSK